MTKPTSTEWCFVILTIFSFVLLWRIYCLEIEADVMRTVFNAFIKSMHNSSHVIREKPKLWI